MTTTLSSKGQVVLPASARRRLGLKPGTKFACRIQGSQIVLMPAGVKQARPRLVRSKLKASSPVQVERWADDLGVDKLPRYLRKPAQLTDGHLLEPGRAHDARLVTLAGEIPDATLIP